MLWNHSSLATFLSLTVKAHVHSVTHGQPRKPQHTYVKRAVRKAHFKLNRAFKVIQCHPYWCRQKSMNGTCVVVCTINADVISETYETKIWQRKNRKFVDFNDTTPFWRRSCKKRLRISTKWFILPEARVILTYISAADSMGLCLLVFVQLSLKVEPPESKTVSTKTEFYMK